MPDINNMEPSPYRVSTITCNASISCKVSLPLLFEHISISDDGFVWSEFGTASKGTRPKKKKRDDGTTERKCFDNQVTVVFQFQPSYNPNCKIFKNGNIHMTGIRTAEDGHRMVEIIAAEVRRIAASGVSVVENSDDIVAGDFKIRMINCDFGFPMKIRRKNLHILLMNDLQNVCSFQPLTYPGVKLQYFWNAHNARNDGICRCAKPCFGKGMGQEDGDCKKVTVAVFDSGKTLITGANTFDQVNDAYKYICRVVADNLGEVQKLLPGERLG
jgi:TATA-box binding protein (TBP) (component of TFIID and TFIIIB)